MAGAGRLRERNARAEKEAQKHLEMYTWIRRELISDKLPSHWKENSTG